MADKNDKVEGNAPGQYYVDSTCIDCDACRAAAPDNFGRNEDKGYSFVSTQPANAAEEDACKEAMEACPVEAIGDDGA